jgi:hypothetical protein
VIKCQSAAESILGITGADGQWAIRVMIWACLYYRNGEYYGSVIEGIP